ncbi:putative immunity protein [Intrasporangium sp.]|uniref:putative immunity protein n=1 Tax=Intrasporangium sp. TaxID=1925024 RepID=UPI003221F9AD
MILPPVRDPRLVTIRRGGTLTDEHHQLLALWAAACAEHVLSLFEATAPGDPRPRAAVEAARTWARGELTMMRTRALGGHAMAAARPLRGAPRFAAYAAGQAAVVAHVPEHDLGAAAYAIKAARVSVTPAEAQDAGSYECRWQREQLPMAIRALVIEDQARRNDLCWSVFDC